MSRTDDACVGEAVEEQKPAAAAAAAAATVEASAPLEPSPAQSPGNEEVLFVICVYRVEECRYKSV